MDLFPLIVLFKVIIFWQGPKPSSSDNFLSTSTAWCLKEFIIRKEKNHATDVFFVYIITGQIQKNICPNHLHIPYFQERL